MYSFLICTLCCIMYAGSAICPGFQIVPAGSAYYTYRIIAKTKRPCTNLPIFFISFILKSVLNSIVCFLHFSSPYTQVRLIHEVALFSRFYGKYWAKNILNYFHFHTYTIVFCSVTLTDTQELATYVIRTFQLQRVSSLNVSTPVLIYLTYTTLKTI